MFPRRSCAGRNSREREETTLAWSHLHIFLVCLIIMPSRISSSSSSKEKSRRCGTRPCTIRRALPFTIRNEASVASKPEKAPRRSEQSCQRQPR